MKVGEIWVPSIQAPTAIFQKISELATKKNSPIIQIDKQHPPININNVTIEILNPQRGIESKRDFVNNNHSLVLNICIKKTCASDRKY